MAEGADPSSNPFYAWGNGPLDTGNASFDDISVAAGDGVAVEDKPRVRIESPKGGSVLLFDMA